MEVGSADVVDIGDAEADPVDGVVSFVNGEFPFDDEVVGFLGGVVADAMDELIIEERDEQGLDAEGGGALSWEFNGCYRIQFHR